MDPEWDPQSLLGLSSGYWQSCVLHTAVALDLFSQLLDRPSKVADLANKVGADREALHRLLTALVAMELLRLDGDIYACRDSASEFLARQSPRYLGHIIRHHRQLMASWMHLDQAVSRGAAVRSPYAGDDPEWRRNFLLGMFDLAMVSAPKVVEQIDFSRCRRMLDLGGGPGAWAVHFCLRNPQLQATVFDLPTSRAFAEETIARFDLQGRIAFAGGNFLQQQLTGNYDLIWISHILHGEGPREAQTVLDRAAAVLEPGGLLLIHEFILDDELNGPLFPALFSLNMLLGTPKGRSYTRRELFALLGASGFRDARLLDLGIPEESSVIAATI